MAGPRALRLPLILILLCVCIVSEAKKKTNCMYQGKLYDPGQVIEALDCVEFKCSDEGEETELALIKDCTCGKDGLNTTPNKTNVFAECGLCAYDSGFGSSHTMNKYSGPSSECGEYRNHTLSQADIEKIVKLHNDLRNKVAKGNEKRGKPGPQPKAANMFELRWNCQLAEVAQRWAEQCDFFRQEPVFNRKICNQDYKSDIVGQNIILGIDKSMLSSEQRGLEWAINRWYEQVKDMPRGLVRQYKGQYKAEYSQIVWAETYEIGCGGIHYPRTDDRYDPPYTDYRTIFVCNYGPAGNAVGKAVYEIGCPASNCPNGKSENYDGLCAPPS